MTVIPEAPSYAPLADARQLTANAEAAFAAAWLERDAALMARIAELEHGTKPPTLFGTSRPDLIDGDPIVPAVRTYLSENQRPSAWTADSGLSRAYGYSTAAIVLSFKATPGAWLEGLLDSMSDLERTIYVCDWHEPFDNFSSNPAEYHARRDVSTPLIAQFPNAVACTILDGSHPESWNLFARDDVEVNGMDRYNPGIQTPRAYVPPLEVFEPYLEWADARGDRTLIGETGTGLVAGTLEAARADWTANAHWVLADAGVEVACWWAGSKATLPPATTFDRWMQG